MSWSIYGRQLKLLQTRRVEPMAKMTVTILKPSRNGQEVERIFPIEFHVGPQCERNSMNPVASFASQAC